MSNNNSYSYCLLQYRHNPWLQERLNIGVLLLSDRSNFLRLKVRGWQGRVTSAYPDLNKSAFTEDLKQLDRAVFKYSKGGFRQSSLFSKNLLTDLSTQMNPAHTIATSLAPAGDSSYEWKPGGVGTAANLDAKLQALFHRFVEPYEVERKPAKRTDVEVWARTGQLIRERQLDEHIDLEPLVQTEFGRVKFQAGYRNGAYHVVQPLSFDLADNEHVGAKAAKWAGYANALTNTHGVRANPKFVLGPPLQDDLQETFFSATKHLKKIVGSENVYLESESHLLVDRISDDIRLH